MNRAAQLRDGGRALAVRMDAVCQQHREAVALGIKPEGSSGETGVAPAGKAAAETVRVSERPAEAARLPAGGAGVLAECFPQEAGVPEPSVEAQPRLRVPAEVGGGAEQSGVAGDAFPGAAVLVVHFAFEQAVAPAAV